MMALRRAGYSSYLLTHRVGSSSPPIHTRMDSHMHHLVAGALALRGQGGSGVSPGFTLWSPSINPGEEEILREVTERLVLVVSLGKPSLERICFCLYWVLNGGGLISQFKALHRSFNLSV